MMEKKVKKYPCQECQDDEITSAFRDLHHKLVDEIIKFCKNYNVQIDDFHLSADGVIDSIPYGEWKSCTDSALTFIKYSDEYKKAFWKMDREMLKNMSKKDLDKLALEGTQTILFSA